MTRVVRDFIDLRQPKDMLCLYPPLWPPQDAPEQLARRAHDRQVAKEAWDRIDARRHRASKRDLEFQEREMSGRSCPWSPDPPRAGEVRA